MSDVIEEEKPGTMENLAAYFQQNAEAAPDGWDIKVSHYSRRGNPNSVFFISDATRVPAYFKHAYPYGIALGDIDVVGAHHEKVENATIIHQYFKLNGYMEQVEWEANNKKQPVPSREEVIVELMQDPYFLSVCINMHVIKVEDSQGNVLDVENLTVPFVPAGSAPAPAPVASVEAPPAPQAPQ